MIVSEIHFSAIFDTAGIIVTNIQLQVERISLGFSNDINIKCCLGLSELVYHFIFQCDK